MKCHPTAEVRCISYGQLWSWLKPWLLSRISAIELSANHGRICSSLTCGCVLLLYSSSSMSYASYPPTWKKLNLELLSTFGYNGSSKEWYRFNTSFTTSLEALKIAKEALFEREIVNKFLTGLLLQGLIEPTLGCSLYFLGTRVIFLPSFINL